MNRNLPHEDPSLRQQTAQSTLTDEQFTAAITPDKCTRADRIFQVFSFIFLFGWLRLILFIIVNLVYIIVMIPVVVFCRYEPIVKYLRNPAFQFTRFYIRGFVFCLGVFWIRRTGKIDYSARATIFNHNSIIDGPILYIYRPFLVIVMKELEKVPVFGAILVAAESVFVDRSKQEGQAARMKAAMNEPTRMSLAVAPEGKTTRGHFMLAFRTGGFLTEQPVQPVTIRYRLKFAFGKTTLCWVVGGFKEWIWRSLCTPAVIVEIHYLPTLQGDEFQALPPKEKALRCQLMMANDLGVLASNRDNRGSFPPASEDKKNS
jgi:1-acyl-sn-glycerol-3-phosphate acyltransferase